MINQLIYLLMTVVSDIVKDFTGGNNNWGYILVKVLLLNIFLPLLKRLGKYLYEAIIKPFVDKIKNHSHGRESGSDKK